MKYDGMMWLSALIHMLMFWRPRFSIAYWELNIGLLFTLLNTDAVVSIDGNDLMQFAQQKSLWPNLSLVENTVWTSDYSERKNVIKTFDWLLQ